MLCQLRYYYRPEPNFDIDRVEVKLIAQPEILCWTVNRKYFEPIHGLYRLTLLMPNKLATALDICKNTDEDGRFLIALLLDLLEVKTKLK